jgi:hypothetical protein
LLASRPTPIYNIKKSIEALLKASKAIGLEVNAYQTKYMFTQKMDVARSSEAFVSYRNTTRCYTPEDLVAIMPAHGHNLMIANKSFEQKDLMGSIWRIT